MKVQSIAGRGKSVSEICQSVEGAREERASSPQPSPPEEERERISLIHALNNQTELS